MKVPLINKLLGCIALLLVNDTFAAVSYATRSDEVTWQVDSSKFMCRLSHSIDGFGDAVFEREAGRRTQFQLKSSMARMKTGRAALTVRPPAWSSQRSTKQLATVNVKESQQPITIGRKLSERMLAELERGLLLDFQRQALYGGNQPIKVTVSSIGFKESYQEYLRCQGSLLSVNYEQIERSTLLYDNEEEDLKKSVKRRLDTIVSYLKEDANVKAVYLDGHTDSEGIRGENLLKSQRRAERVFDYLVEKGIPADSIVMRWHGERYPVQSNRTKKGKAKNRRVTIRLSKEPPKFVASEQSNTPKEAMMKKDKESMMKKDKESAMMADKELMSKDEMLKEAAGAEETIGNGNKGNLLK